MQSSNAHHVWLNDCLSWTCAVVWSGSVCVKDNLLCSRLHADAGDSSAVWVETQLWRRRFDVARRMHHS